MDSLLVVSINFRWVTKYISDKKPESLAGKLSIGVPDHNRRCQENEDIPQRAIAQQGNK